MPHGPLRHILNRVRRLLVPASAEDDSDAALLERFLRGREEEAFALLVERHGPLVLGVARRLLRHEQDAEDVFQATFLVLARKAAAVRNRAALGAWLYAVACRLARRASAARARRPLDTPMAEFPQKDPPDAVALRDVRAVLDEELNRLPDKYRLAVLLCDLQGKTHEQAAQQLGCPAGSMSWRLGRARDLLRERLTRRGVTLSAAALSAALAQAAAAAVPAVLRTETVRAALLFAAGQTGAGVMSAPVATLVNGMLKTMFLSKLLIAAVLFLALGLLGVGLLAGSGSPPGDPAAGTSPAAAQAAPKSQPPEKAARKDVHGDPLPAGALARMGALRLRHGGAVRSLAVSTDGKRIASGSADGTVRLWDAATGRELRRFPGDTFAGAVVAFSPDGNFLATGGAGDTVALWEVSTGREHLRLRHPKGVFSLTFSPDGKWLAVGTDDKPGIRLWEAATGRALWQFGEREDGLALAFAPDGHTLASHGALWDLPTPKNPALDAPARRRLPVPSWCTGLAFSPDGKALLGNASRVVEHQELTAPWKNRLFRAPAGTVFHAAALSPNGKAVATGGSDGVVRLWDVASAKEVRELRGHLKDVDALAFAADGNTLVSAGKDRVIRLWDVATGEERLPFAGHLDAVVEVALAPDGRTLATASRDGTARLWDAATGKELRVLRGHRDAVWSVAFSPDSKTVASAGEDRTVRLWDVATGKELRQLLGHTLMASSVAFAPDGKSLASAGVQTVRLWDPATGKPLRRIDNHRTGPQTVAFSPDGKYLLAWEHPEYRPRLYFGKDMDKGAGLWEVATGKEVRRLKLAGRMMPLAWAPDGKTLASGGGDRHIHIWESGQDREVRQFGPHESFLLALAFSPDGHAVASASIAPRPGWGAGRGKLDPTVHVWDAATGARLRRFAGHADAVWSVGFSRDGRLLASGSADGTALVWDVSALAKKHRE